MEYSGKRCRAGSGSGLTGRRNEVKSERPPIGVMPRKLWQEKRMEALARAIRDRIAAGICDEKAYEWSVELCDMLEERERK